jgi:RHS repeat-associated protein
MAGTNNRLASPYAYDAAGNVTYDGVHHYTYDPENHIISVDNGATTYTYDALGRRAAKTAGGSATDFIYDREDHVILTNPATPTMIEMYAAGLHLGTYVLNAAQTATVLYYDHADWLGTERARTDLSGNACEKISSLPFGDGQTISGTCGDISPRHFTGKERDPESGLDNFEARYNSSSMGRFMSADPIFISPAGLFDPQGLNLYAYVRNNPLNFTDPTGLDSYLACQTENHSGCGQVDNGSEQIWVQGQTVDGKFQAYDIDMNRDGSGLYSDQFGHDYTGTFDQNGLSFNSVDEGGPSGSGRFINGSDETDVNGSGIFSGLQGKFVSDCGGSCQARGSLYELEPGSGAMGRAEAALQLQGKSWSWLDRLSGAHAEGRQWMDANGRIHVIENINGINAGKTELHFEGHPNTGVTERSLHLVNAIRDLASGRAEEQKNLKLP